MQGVVKKKIVNDSFNLINQTVTDSVEYIEDLTINLYYQIASRNPQDSEFVKSLFDTYRSQLIVEKAELTGRIISEVVLHEK